MVLRVAGGRRQVLMVQLMMVSVRGDGAAAEDILDEERRPAGGSSVLAWLSLLLLAGRLHLFSFDATLRLRRVHAPRLHPRPSGTPRSRDPDRAGGSSPTTPFFAPGEVARGSVFTTRRENPTLKTGHFSADVDRRSLGPYLAQLT